MKTLLILLLLTTPTLAVERGTIWVYPSTPGYDFYWWNYYPESGQFNLQGSDGSYYTGTHRDRDWSIYEITPPDTDGEGEADE